MPCPGVVVLPPHAFLLSNPNMKSNHTRGHWVSYKGLYNPLVYRDVNFQIILENPYINII